MTQVQFKVNGTPKTLTPETGEVLLQTLRNRWALIGAKPACERGECGACTVLLNGEPIYSCLTLTAACSGTAVVTIEGLAAPNGDLHPVQRAFVTHDAVQCGYCTPGQVLAAVSLLGRDPNPSDEAIREAMSGNLCRCGTYPKIAAAIRAVAAEGAHG